MLPLHPQTKIKDDSVAQLVEQMTLNHWAEGSNPSGVTIEQPNWLLFFLHGGILTEKLTHRQMAVETLRTFSVCSLIFARKNSNPYSGGTV